MTREPKRRGVGCGCLLGVVGFVFFFFLMMAGIGQGLIELGWTVVFGWTSFLARVVPRISWDPGAIATGVLFLGLFAFIGHSFVAWLVRSVATARKVSFQWRWKWTAAAMVLIALCFLVGMAVAGAAHQLGWIMESNESLFQDRYGMYRHREVGDVDRAFRQALLDTNTLPELRKDIPHLLKGSYDRRLSPLESVRVLVSLGPSNTVKGVIIRSTDNQFETRFGGRYVTAKDSNTLTAKDLKALIQSSSTNLVSF